MTALVVILGAQLALQLILGMQLTQSITRLQSRVRALTEAIYLLDGRITIVARRLGPWIAEKRADKTFAEEEISTKKDVPK